MEIQNRTFLTIPAAPGIAVGRVMKLAAAVNVAPEKERISPEQTDGEIERFHRAVAATKDQLQKLQADLRRKLNSRDADIFDAQLLLVEDRSLNKEVEKRIAQEQCNAEYALYESIEHFIAVFSQVKDEYLRERALDLKDIGSRLMENLSDAAIALLNLDDRRIIVGSSLTPSETARLDSSRVLGFVLENGSVTSHTSILARSLNLPAVVGMPSAAVASLSNADKIIVDGYSGRVIINPDSRTEEAYLLKAKAAGDLFNKLQSENALPAQTTDGFEIPLEANLDTVGSDFETLRRSGFSGVGLFRTEFLYLNTRHLPFEEEQYEIYKRLLINAGSLPVTIRTFDLGGDKAIRGVTPENEANPFLGLRGIRLALDEQKELFKIQLRALLRAGVYGNLRIMIPMVSSIHELEETKALIEELKTQLETQGIEHARELPLGVMIETPAAALIADTLARNCDFFSVGTNDLVQYTRAIDRGNERVSYLYRPSHPAVLKLIQMTQEGARESGIPVTVCGQMAGDPVLAILLVGLGIQNLSMTERSAPLVRRAIRQVSSYECDTAAQNALRCTNSEDALRFAADLLRSRAPELVDFQE